MNQNYMVCVLSHSLHYLILTVLDFVLDFIFFDLGVVSEFGDRSQGVRSDAFPIISTVFA